MLPGEVAAAIDHYVDRLRHESDGQVAAVYAAGAIALDDFSPRQSNVDLVVVCDPLLSAEGARAARRAERALDRAGRRAEVWYTTWEEVAGGSAASAGGQGDGRRRAGVGEAGVGDDVGSGEGGAAASALATPMTRSLLRHDPLALFGPDWPVVDYDADSFRSWCLGRLESLAAGDKGLLVLRRAVTPMVLEAARLAQGAITGRLFSKSEAGESVGAVVSPRYRRILTDTVGYRRGAQTSMYWGPFERKYDALILVRDLLDAAAAA
ncbi:MAG: hypothetical protein ACRDYY_07415 [Acidimicrobiales bacterium]